MELPADFLEMMKDHPGLDLNRFREALLGTAPVSIRLNPFKPIPDFDDCESVPWHPLGKYLPERPNFTLDPLFHAGTYYVQEASSMAICQALFQHTDLSKKMTVLDLCAAPGGKSTVLLSAISPDSFLLANEVIKARIPALRQNLTKWGRTNFMVSQHDPADFAGLKGTFDVVLVDAPCSGEGLFRKDPNACREWSLEQVGLCSARQRRILGEAQALVKAGGLLIYSTCTYNKLENDQQVEALLETGQFNVAPLTFPAEWGIAATQYGYQFYPNRLRGEGFYMSVLKNNGETAPAGTRQKVRKEFTRLSKKELAPIESWVAEPGQFAFFQKPNQEIVAIPKDLEEHFLLVANNLSRRSFGLHIGQVKQHKLVPSHELALSHLTSNRIPAVELDLEPARDFLRKEPFALDTPQKGWHLIRFRGHDLGWAKLLGNRFNNYLPTEWRIRNY